jgi:transcriptional regulator with XRE-family HTH domain
MTTNERLKQIRKTLGLTQVKFAKRIGISTSYVAELELGNRKVNDRTMRLISMEFNIDEHWIRTGEGTMYNEAAEANLAKITSLFRSLSPQYQDCALIQMNALNELYNMDTEG